VENLTTLAKEMRSVLKVEPDLTPNGMKSDRRTLGYDYDGLPEELLEEDVLKQFETCKRWLSEVLRIKTFNQKHTSYGYKHMVERWANRYVCNGAFIAAAIALKIPIQRSHPRSPNVLLPISEKWVKQMQKLERQNANDRVRL
jgi:hypothetical protein